MKSIRTLGLVPQAPALRGREVRRQEPLRQLAEHLKNVDQDHYTHGNYFFYMATAPEFFGAIAENLAGAGLLEENLSTGGASSSKSRLVTTLIPPGR